MNTQRTIEEAELDRLEAELPWIDRLWARTRLMIARLTRSHRSLVVAFEKETNLVAKIVDLHDYGILSQSVRIPRLAGLRESSCDWTILMVVDHLNRYNEFLLGSIADHVGSAPTFHSYRYFEPNDSNSESIDAFQENAWHIVSTLNNLIEKGSFRGASGTTFHPLYGNVDAKSLVAIAWLHAQLHRRQIQKILAVEGVV